MEVAPVKFLVRCSTVALLAALVLACAPPAGQEPAEPSEPSEPAPSAAEVRQAIEQAAEAFRTAALAEDAEGIVAIYTSDAVLMPPNMPAQEGSAAIRTWMSDFFTQFTIDEFQLRTEEIEVAGDWAYRRGAFEMTTTPTAGGDPVQDAGKFIEIWQRQADGSWKMSHDMWNTDTPPPGM